MSRRRGPENVLILLGAGMGRRMGGGRPKMLIPLRGRPLLYWALKNFEHCAAVDALILSAPVSHRAVFERLVKRWRFKKVIALSPGGRERTDSARNALRCLPRECRLVGIHDGARPFVSARLVAECFRAAEKEGAAILAVPSKDTVKLARGRGGKLYVGRTPPRELCWSAQTPQVFRRRIVEAIHARAAKKGKGLPTDDASLAEARRYPVRIVAGDYDNIKITTPGDLLLAEQILKRQ